MCLEVGQPDLLCYLTHLENPWFIYLDVNIFVLVIARIVSCDATCTQLKTVYWGMSVLCAVVCHCNSIKNRIVFEKCICVKSTLDGLLVQLVSLYTVHKYLNWEILCTSVLIVSRTGHDCVLNIHGQSDRPGHSSKSLGLSFLFLAISFLAYMERIFNKNRAVMDLT